MSSGTALLSRDGSRVTLFLDGVESSCIDVDHPEDLEFEYMQQMSAVLAAAVPPPRPVRALHLGGAACALPWAWDTARPGSRQTAVEVDASLAGQVRGWFDLPRSPRLRIRVGDARQVLASTRAGSVDVVVRDAFDHGVVPAHLATVGAARLAERALVPGGLYLVNTPHGGPFDARPDVAAIAAAFPFVCAVADPKVGRSARRGNIVVVARTAGADEDAASPVAAGGGAAAVPPWLDEVNRLLRRLPLPARLMDPGALVRWLAGARPATDPGPAVGPATGPSGSLGAGGH